MRRAIALLVGVAALAMATACLPPGPPKGSVDALAVAGPNLVPIAGWTFDGDVPKRPTWVEVSYDGVVVTSIDANLSRPDVAEVYPDAGDAHGFDAVLGISTGIHEVCVTAANIGFGFPVKLGCQQVVVAAHDPFGVLDEVRRVGSQVQVSGWAVDPDSPATLVVSISANGLFIGNLATGGSRPDVGAVYPAGGQSSGYSGLVTPPSTGQVICATANNVGVGSSYLLGCRTPS